MLVNPHQRNVDASNFRVSRWRNHAPDLPPASHALDPLTHTCFISPSPHLIPSPQPQTKTSCQSRLPSPLPYRTPLPPDTEVTGVKRDNVGRSGLPECMHPSSVQEGLTVQSLTIYAAVLGCICCWSAISDVNRSGPLRSWREVVVAGFDDSRLKMGVCDIVSPQLHSSFVCLEVYSGDWPSILHGNSVPASTRRHVQLQCPYVKQDIRSFLSG